MPGQQRVDVSLAETIPQADVGRRNVLHDQDVLIAIKVQYGRYKTRAVFSMLAERIRLHFGAVLRQRPPGPNDTHVWRRLLDANGALASLHDEHVV